MIFKYIINLILNYFIIIYVLIKKMKCIFRNIILLIMTKMNNLMTQIISLEKQYPVAIPSIY